MYLVFVLYALFASVFTICKTALEFTEPFFLIGSRMTVAGILMLAYEYYTKPERFSLRKQDFFRVTKLALFNIYLTNACEFWGLKNLTSFKTCFIYSLSPFLSALFSYILLKEKITQKKWIGLAVGFSGFIPILLTQSSTEELSGQFFFLSWAEISVMCAATCSVYGWILLRQLVNESRMTPMMANGFSMFMGGVLALIHSRATENWNPIPVYSFLPFLECALLLLVISNFAAYNLYGHLLKKYTATFMSFAGLTTPIFTALFGWIFLGEIVTYEFYFSLCVVFAGLLLFHQEELKHGYKLPATAK